MNKMAGPKFSDAVTFIQSLTIRKLFNGFLLFTSYFLSKLSGQYIHWGKPISLSVEPTNLCNLKCPECPSGTNTLNRPRLYLSWPQYKKTVDETAPWLTYLQLFFQGEPFMHPKIFDFIAYATSKNIYTATSTNGQFITKYNSIKLVQSGLKRIIISIDGVTQKTYEQYRVGGSLDLATASIQHIIKARKQLNKKYPMIIVQFVVFKSNEDEVDNIKRLSQEWGGDSCEIKTAQFESFEQGNSEMPENVSLSRYRKSKNGTYYLNRKKVFKCRRIWNSAVISAENKVLPCCFDKKAEHAYTGSKNVLDSWKGNSAKQFRKKVWTKPGKLGICQNCTEGVRSVYVK